MTVPSLIREKVFGRQALLLFPYKEKKSLSQCHKRPKRSKFKRAKPLKTRRFLGGPTCDSTRKRHCHYCHKKYSRAHAGNSAHRASPGLDWRRIREKSENYASTEVSAPRDAQRRPGSTFLLARPLSLLIALRRNKTLHTGRACMRACGIKEINARPAQQHTGGHARRINKGEHSSTAAQHTGGHALRPATMHSSTAGTRARMRPGLGRARHAE